MKTALFECPLDNEKIKLLLENVDYSPLLVPSSKPAWVEEVCQDAIHFGIGRIVAIDPFQDAVLERIKGTKVRLVHGVGDLCTQEDAIASAELSFSKGADEMDMMFRQSLFFDGKYDELQNYIRKMADVAEKYGKIIKVIIETGYLTDEQKIEASRLSLDAGATYIKTNLGMRPGRATLHDILLLKEAFGDRIKIKASGNVASLEDAWVMWNAGAERFAFRELLVKQLKNIGYEP